MDDKHYMQVALEEAEEALSRGQLPVGAVIVRNDKIICSSRNQVESLESLIAHAEMQAILGAQDCLYRHRGECIIYTTLEPCLMCLGAIIYSRFKKLVIAARAPGVGALAFRDSLSGFYEENFPETVIGVLEEESRDLLREYYNRTGLRGDLLDL